MAKIERGIKELDATLLNALIEKITVGRNGSGKTTIINLLTRMYEPKKGRILLGAEDISKLSLQEYWNMVSVVSPQIYLFNDTIIFVCISR